jgi:uncharacterized low-complexity protein
MPQTRKPVALAIGATLAGGLMLSGSAFASTQLAQGYLLGAQDAGAAAAADKAKEGSCGAGKKAGAEGKCGVAEMDADKDGKVSRSEFAAAHADEAGEFDRIDANKDGFMDAGESKAHHTEGSCGAKKEEGAMKAGDGMKTEAKADMEGKCGEGKCGEGKCGGSI